MYFGPVAYYEIKCLYLVSWYKYLSVILVLWNGNFFLIAPFPDHCLLVHFCLLNRTGS